MTMYKSYNKFARDLILYFLKKHFASKKPLVQPINPLPLFHDESELAAILTSDDFNVDFKILLRETVRMNCKIPVSPTIS